GVCVKVCPENAIKRKEME
ncbi:MAG: 4Fe-4S binding protein, partial [Candidatus Helarchaeales archaeon]